MTCPKFLTSPITFYYCPSLRCPWRAWKCHGKCMDFHAKFSMEYWPLFSMHIHGTPCSSMEKHSMGSGEIMIFISMENQSLSMAVAKSSMEKTSISMAYSSMEISSPAMAPKVISMEKISFPWKKILFPWKMHFFHGKWPSPYTLVGRHMVESVR